MFYNFAIFDQEHKILLIKKNNNKNRYLDTRLPIRANPLRSQIVNIFKIIIMKRNLKYLLSLNHLSFFLQKSIMLQSFKKLNYL